MTSPSTLIHDRIRAATANRDVADRQVADRIRFRGRDRMLYRREHVRYAEWVDLGGEA